MHFWLYQSQQLNGFNDLWLWGFHIFDLFIQFGVSGHAHSIEILNSNQMKSIKRCYVCFTGSYFILQWEKEKNQIEKNGCVNYQWISHWNSKWFPMSYFKFQNFPHAIPQLDCVFVFQSNVIHVCVFFCLFACTETDINHIRHSNFSAQLNENCGYRNLSAHFSGFRFYSR